MKKNRKTLVPFPREILVWDVKFGVYKQLQCFQSSFPFILFWGEPPPKPWHDFAKLQVNQNTDLFMTGELQPENFPRVAPFSTLPFLSLSDLRFFREEPEFPFRTGESTLKMKYC